MDYIDNMNTAELLTLLFVSLIIIALFYTFGCFPYYKIFKRADEKGWKAFVPIYNLYLIGKVARDKLLGWLYVFAIIVVIIAIIAIRQNFILLVVLAAIYNIVIFVLVNINLANRFKRGMVFKVLLCMAPFVGVCLDILLSGITEEISEANYIVEQITTLIAYIAYWAMLLNLGISKKYPTYYKFGEEER